MESPDGWGQLSCRPRMWLCWALASTSFNTHVTYFQTLMGLGAACAKGWRWSQATCHMPQKNRFKSLTRLENRASVSHFCLQGVVLVDVFGPSGTGQCSAWRIAGERARSCAGLFLGRRQGSYWKEAFFHLGLLSLNTVDALGKALWQ